MPEDFQWFDALSVEAINLSELPTAALTKTLDLGDGNQGLILRPFNKDDLNAFGLPPEWNLSTEAGGYGGGVGTPLENLFKTNETVLGLIKYKNTNTLEADNIELYLSVLAKNIEGVEIIGSELWDEYAFTGENSAVRHIKFSGNNGNDALAIFDSFHTLDSIGFDGNFTYRNYFDGGGNHDSLILPGTVADYYFLDAPDVDKRLKFTIKGTDIQTPSGNPSKANETGHLDIYDVEEISFDAGPKIVISEAGAFIETYSSFQIPDQSIDLNLALMGSKAIRGTGNSGNNLMIGSSADNTMQGKDGDDDLIGRGGHDTIFGGKGEDYLFGNNGHDKITGGPGRDLIHGGNGDDIIKGAAGKDKLKGGNGADIFIGSKGKDIILDFNPEEGDVLQGFGKLDSIKIINRGNHTLITSNTYQAVLRNIQDTELLTFNDSIFT